MWIKSTMTSRSDKEVDLIISSFRFIFNLHFKLFPSDWIDQLQFKEFYIPRGKLPQRSRWVEASLALSQNSLHPSSSSFRPQLGCMMRFMPTAAPWSRPPQQDGILTPPEAGELSTRSVAQRWGRRGVHGTDVGTRRSFPWLLTEMEPRKVPASPLLLLLRVQPNIFWRHVGGGVRGAGPGAWRGPNR